MLIGKGMYASHAQGRTVDAVHLGKSSPDASDPALRQGHLTGRDEGLVGIER